MPLPTNQVAYRDVQAMMARAIETPKGVKIKCESRGKAVQLRQRIYKFRQTERADSKKMYAVDDPRYGATDYDELAVMIREEDGLFFVYLEKFMDKEQINAIIEEL